MSRTRSNTFFTRVFEELARLGVPGVYYGTSIWLSNAISISRHRSLALYPASTCTKWSYIESLKLSSRAIGAINYCLIPIDTIVWSPIITTFNTLFSQWFDKHISTLFPCDVLFSHIQLSDLLHQLTLRLLHIIISSFSLKKALRKCIFLFLYLWLSHLVSLGTNRTHVIRHFIK